MDETLYNNEERINRYLQGEMTQEEEGLFEEELAKDDTLRRQAEAMARIIKGMEVVGKEHDKEYIQKLKAHDDVVKTAAQTSKKRLTPVWWISIAAGLAILLIVGYHFYDRSQTIALGRQYAQVFPVETIIRGEEDEDVANNLTALYNNVTNGEDLENTITQLDSLWALSQSDIYNGYTTYEPYIGWNLAIAHLQNNDKKEAKGVLKQMHLNYPEGTAMGDEVVALLREL